MPTTLVGGRIRRTMQRHENVDEEEAVFFKQGQCRLQLWGRHLHGSLVRAQKPADGEREPN
jgi:hypothetical protein